MVKKGWDDTVNDNSLNQMMARVVTKVCQDKPAYGDWCVARHKLNSWVDATPLATGGVLERYGTILEDTCRLQASNNAQHINLAEGP